MSLNEEMYVTKRDGKREIVSFDKILNRIKKIGQEANMKLNYTTLVMKVIDQLYDGISTTKIDELSAEQCASMASIHPDYNVLAGSIIISNHHRNTSDSFIEVMTKLYNFIDKHGKQSPIIAEETYQIIVTNAYELEKMCDYSRDYLIDYFGFKTLERAYLMRIDSKIVERVQHMWLRVAVGIHGSDLKHVKETYDLMSQKYFTHATPTLFNSGTPRPQLSSCFEKGTLVNTLRGPVPISEVVLGDDVITHKGNVKKVLQIHKNHLADRKVYKVNIHKTPEFKVTGNHKLFVYNKKTQENGWKPVDELTVFDYIMIPNNPGSICETEMDVFDIVNNYDFSNNYNKQTIEFTEDKSKIFLTTHWSSTHLNGGQEIDIARKSTAINSRLVVDKKLMKFFGIWFGDGHIMVSKGRNKDNTVIRGIGITIHKDNAKLIDFCSEMKHHFGIENVTFHSMKKQNVTQVLFNCPILGMLFHKLFGKGFSGKRLYKDFYRYDTDLVKSFMSGLVTTDGCISKEGIVSLCMANEQLMREIYSLCRIHNIDISKPNPVKFGKLTKTQAYCISLTNLKNDLGDVWKTYPDDRIQKLGDKKYFDGKVIIKDDYKYLRFNSREETEIDDEYVYTLGVEDDHSYSIEGIIAENCFLLAMESDSIDGIYNTLKDCASISKWAGGIGLHIHNIRASGSHIRGTNGSSNGIVPMLKVFNNTAKYVDQCLDPDTIVYTKRGAVPIKSIVPGDEVVTDNGQFYEIGKVLDNQYVGDFYTLQVRDAMEDIKMTDMHPLWCVANPEGQDSYHVYNMLEKKMVVPDFVEVKNINVNDYVGFPIPTYEKDIRDYSEDDCRFYGIFIYSLAVQKDHIVGPDFKLSISNTKPNTVQFVNDYLNSYAIPLSKSEDVDQDLTVFEWDRVNRFKFTYEMFCEGVPGLLHLPKPKLVQLVRGMLTCGNTVFDGQHYHLKVDTHKNNNLLEHLRYMLLRLGVLTRGPTLRISATDFNKIFDIDVMQPVGPHDYFEYNGTLFSRVVDNSFVSEYSGRVIDIEVDNDEHHNFLTASGLVKNGGGKRNGSFAIYLEPWHADVELFLQMRKNHGDEELKARDLFYALWVPDLFMERIKADGQWTLMCPDECPGLSDVYGEAFVELYTKYEKEGRGRATMKARDLWFQVLDAQMETGTPYLVYKDAANKKSNQQNVGTIKSSNLCSEIIEYSDANETAVCNLASLALPSFVDTSDPENPTFDYDKLHEVTRVVTYNLNKIIDVNYYPTEKTRRSNMRHRPIGIGVQGLADVFMLLDVAFTSEEAKKINHRIFETIYHGAVEKSCEMAMESGAYETFAGSPASQGKLQFDLWNVEPTLPGETPRYQWNTLKQYVMRYGLRNSLLLAPMPTASTSQILGNNECIEPITSNIYNRRTLAGEFILANKYLMKDLIKLDLWNEKVKNNIIANNGSIQHIDVIPQEIREKYKTVWEIPMRTLIDMAADRGAFVCQSQSLNLWLEDPNYNMLTSMHFYAWSKGLKTGIYYLRRRGRHQAQQFTIEPEKKDITGQIYEEEEVCEMCSA